MDPELQRRLDQWYEQRCRETEETGSPEYQALKEESLELQRGRLRRRLEKGEFDLEDADHFEARAWMFSKKDARRKQTRRTNLPTNQRLHRRLAATREQNLRRQVARLLLDWLLERGEWPRLAQKVLDGKTTAQLAEEESVSPRTIAERLREERIKYRALRGDFERYCLDHARFDVEKILASVAQLYTAVVRHDTDALAGDSPGEGE